MKTALGRILCPTPRVRGLLVVLLALLLTFIMVKGVVYPFDGLTAHRDDYYEDVGQAVWNLWSTTESVLSLRSPYDTDLVYHPNGAALGKHTLFPGYLPIPLLAKLLTGGSPMYPVYATNIVTYLAYAAILLFTFLALRQVGFGLWASAVPAIGYAFCDFFYLHWWHLNHLAAFTLPLATWLAVRLWAQPTRARLWGLLAVVAWSFYLTEFALSIAISALLFLLGSLAVPSLRREWAGRLRAFAVRDLALAALAFALALTPFAIAYVRADALVQPARYFSQWSANLAGFFVPSSESTPLYREAFKSLSDRITVGLPGYETFLGYPILLTALAGLFLQRKPIAWIAFAVGAIFFVLSLGPTLKVFSTDTGLALPYAGLMKLPPFDQNRCPVRFVVFGQFFLLFACAHGLQGLSRLFERRVHATAAPILMSALAAWILLECAPPRLPEHKSFTPPLAKLAELVPGPVVHTSLPPRACNEMLLQVFHGHPIANGCLARPTQAQQEFVQSLRQGMAAGPDQYTRVLTQAGFKNIIVDRAYPPQMMQALLSLPFKVLVLDAP